MTRETIYHKIYPNLNNFCKENCDIGAFEIIDSSGKSYFSHFKNEQARIFHGKKILEVRKDYCDKCLATLVLNDSD